MKNKNRNNFVWLFMVGAALVIIILALGLSGVGGNRKESTLPSPAAISTSASNQPQNISVTPEVHGDLTAIQIQALDRLSTQSSEVPSITTDQGTVRFLSMDISISDSIAKEPQAKAELFLDSYKDLLQVSNPHEQFSVVGTDRNEQGISFVRFQQSYNGIPIYGSDVIVSVTQNGSIGSFSAGYIPNISNLQIQPGLTADQATQKLISTLGLSNATILETPELYIYDPVVFGQPSSGKPILVWVANIQSDQDFSKYIIDAITGDLVTQFIQIITVRNREIWDAHSSSNLVPDPLTDSRYEQTYNENGLLPNVNSDNSQKVWGNLGIVYDYFYNTFSRDSYDNRGANIKVYVNVNNRCPNAAWILEYKIIYFCKGYADGLDVAAHEFTHGVTSSRGKEGKDFLPIENKKQSQSGALNESYSDIFAAMIDDGIPWVISLDADDSCIIRNLSDPENTIACRRRFDERTQVYTEERNPFIFPKHMDNIASPNQEWCTRDEADYGCSHTNSTIPTYAAYLLTEGGAGSNSDSNVVVRGIGKQKVQRIYYDVLAYGLTANATFLDARNTTLVSCHSMARIGTFGITYDDCEQVKNAFAAVGIGDPSVIPTPVIATPTPGSPIPISGNSSTILLMDTSGSMNDADVSGGRKIDASRGSARSILHLIRSEIQAGVSGSQVGLVGFSNGARVISTLTTDVDSVIALVDLMEARGGTGMPDGLRAALDIYGQSSVTMQRFIILMSDGMANIGLGGQQIDPAQVRQQVLDLAAEAGQAGICVHTVGFGVPNTTGSTSQQNSIDEDLLQRVAAASGCGNYYNAQNAVQLANVFVEVRHASMGNIIFRSSGQITQGQQLAVGAAEVAANQELMLLTLNWPGSQLSAVVTDPAGNQVDANYPGVTIDETGTLVSMIVNQPKAGKWLIDIIGVDVPEGTTFYNVITSTRTGPAAAVPVGGGGLPLVIVAVLVAGTGVAVYTVSRTVRRPGKKGAIPITGAFLTVAGGPAAGNRFTLTDDFIIGRGSSCDLRLADPAVSRQHARIRFAGGNWFIQNAGGKSGIRLNGQPIQAAQIHSGDQIMIGETILIFREG